MCGAGSRAAQGAHWAPSLEKFWLHPFLQEWALRASSQDRCSLPIQWVHRPLPLTHFAQFWVGAPFQISMRGEGEEGGREAGTTFSRGPGLLRPLEALGLFKIAENIIIPEIT